MWHAVGRVVSGDTVNLAVNLSQQDNPEGAGSSGPAIPPREHQAIFQPNPEFLFGHLTLPICLSCSLHHRVFAPPLAPLCGYFSVSENWPQRSTKRTSYLS